MATRRTDWSEVKRTHLLALILLLALVVALPTPSGELTSRREVALLVAWVGVLATAWAVWFRRELLDLFWVVAAVGGLLTYLFRDSAFLLSSLVIWRFWLLYREKRMAKLNLWLVLGLGLGSVPATQAQRLEAPQVIGTITAPAPASTKASTSALAGDNMAYLKGYKINDLTSCRQVDVVPWSLNEENRQARLILRDKLRLSTELKYFDWSVYQTMDTEGSVTFIFERMLSDGAREYYLTKGHVFNRIVKRGTLKSVAEMKKLTNLIDSPALEFYHEDGSRLSFLPGSAGSSKLRVYLAPKAGARILPPLYIDGRHCSRPESAFDQDDEPNKQNSNAPALPSAPVAGGASSAGGSAPAAK
ncbi:MAG TPA: hypothetical protein VM901_02880 [Bdellovibrionota bacterium]|jgi:hypothetical protein|nr:hypothetical protein [Bdellovibrionota bacterium]